MTLAANSAIPAFRKKPALDSSVEPKGHAAGTVIVAPDGAILLLRRGRGENNFASHWALPGGGVDAGETPEEGAAREMREEIGHDLKTPRKLLDQRVTPNGLVFHTFIQPAEGRFTPELNDEHTGHVWADLDDLPQPLHPAVASTLKDRIAGGAEDMTPEDWSGLRDGLLKWLAEEEAEPEHAEDVVMASDSVMTIAMDRDSVREKTVDGRLVVKRTHITKANICPYRGDEIPGWESLGLDPKKIYNLLRDPDELRKAAPTLNGVQLLIKHIPVNADDHRPNETVGSLGTDAEFDGEYLDNSLFVNARDAIDAIETGRQKELSAGYHYKPDMTPGIFRGSGYDGVMRDIVFNHVALVEDGRAGPDVVVGDAALRQENDDMAKVTRFGAMTLSLAAGAISPLLAMDSKVTLPKDLFSSLTTKNFKDNRSKLLSGVRSAIDGKIRQGIALDASMEQFAKALDTFTDDMTAGVDEPAPEEKASMIDELAAVEPAKAPSEPGSTYDAEPLKAFLREKGMGEDDISKVCDMMPKPALDEKKDGDEDDDKKITAQDEDDDGKKDKKDMIDKPAMDAALKAHGEQIARQVRENEQGIRVALAAVKPYVGELPATMAFDSGAAVYRKALEMKGVKDFASIHQDALVPILQTLPKIGDKPVGALERSTIAMDASAVDKARKLAPGLENIRPV